MFVDSHCHLNYKGLVEDQDAVLARARAAGVSAMLNISTRHSEWDAIIATAQKSASIWATVGIHPHEADAHPDTDTATLVAAASHPKVVGIGETGLDYYYDHSDRDRQRHSFRTHITAARDTGLPLIVHTRDAEADTAEILREEMGKGAYSGVIHCFTASRAFADKALELGLKIAQNAPLSNYAITQALPRIADLPAADGLFVESLMSSIAQGDEAAKERVRAFLEKRAAKVSRPT